MNIDIKDIKTQITIGLVVLSLAIAALFYFLTFKPSGERLSQRKVRLDSLEAGIRLLDAAVSESTKFNMELKNMGKKLRQAEKLLPDEKDIPSLLRQITQAGIKTGVRFTAFKPGALTASPAAKLSSVLTVDVSVTGSYSQLGDFMANLGTLSRIVIPAKLKVLPNNDKTRTVKADFVVKAFVFNKAGGVKSDAKDTDKPKRPGKS
ncbi:type 4a pilus biogenesis protein PilO [candidate division TA06 bacterium]|uniref:Type 4a pilus biogenesis protein PilO n=1 Tax=candidate division TA06 bacterium TaxID=2250710 RepID=A0A933IF35_UNCT6|nr:type 4a pilus biogenesis protein PilO [candidate division TA06 bacterium]